MAKKEVQEPTTVYSVLGKNTNSLWEFRYDLEGFLKEFKIIEGVLNEAQISWLFHPKRFPYNESCIKQWQVAIKNIDVKIGLPDVSFETFYNLYGHKIDPKGAEKAWNRTKKSDKMLALKSVKAYKGYLKRKGIAQAYPATFLNKQLYLSQYNSY